MTQKGGEAKLIEIVDRDCGICIEDAELHDLDMERRWDEQLVMMEADCDA
jgi:hypothetical protein